MTSVSVRRRSSHQNVRQLVVCVILILLASITQIHAGPLELRVLDYAVEIPDQAARRILTPGPGPELEDDVLVFMINAGELLNQAHSKVGIPAELTFHVVLSGSFTIGEKVFGVLHSAEGVLRVLDSPETTWNLKQANWGSMFGQTIFKPNEERVAVYLPVTLTQEGSERPANTIHTAMVLDCWVDGGNLEIDRAFFSASNSTRKHFPHSRPLDSLGQWGKPERTEAKTKAKDPDCCYRSGPIAKCKCGDDCDCKGPICSDCDIDACDSLCAVLGCNNC